MSMGLRIRYELDGDPATATEFDVWASDLAVWERVTNRRFTELSGDGAVGMRDMVVMCHAARRRMGKVETVEELEARLSEVVPVPPQAPAEEGGP